MDLVQQFIIMIFDQLWTSTSVRKEILGMQRRAHLTLIGHRKIQFSVTLNAAHFGKRNIGIKYSNISQKRNSLYLVSVTALRAAPLNLVQVWSLKI